MQQWPLRCPFILEDATQINTLPRDCPLLRRHRQRGLETFGGGTEAYPLYQLPWQPEVLQVEDSSETAEKEV